MMTIDEIISVIEAHKAGKTIEANYGEGWVIEKEPMFEFTCDYRIKPESHYRPFKNGDEVMEAIREHGNYLRRRFDKKCMVIEEYDNKAIKLYSTCPKSLKIMFDDYIFADGTPFGIKLSEEEGQ